MARRPSRRRLAHSSWSAVIFWIQWGTTAARCLSAPCLPPPAPEGEDEEAEQQPQPEQRGEERSLTAFFACLQLGDTHALLGRMDESITSYGKGLQIGDRDPRVAKTCRYLAEAHVQALQFNEAEKLCPCQVATTTA